MWASPRTSRHWTSDIPSALGQSAVDRVGVDIVDHGPEGLRLPDISVESAAGLPEQALSPGAASSGDPGKPFGGVFREVAHRATADRLLDRLEDGRHLVSRPARPDDHMDVLRHKDKRPEREIVSLAGQVDRFAQPVARSLGGQEAMASIAGEGQLMGMAGLIIRPTMRSRGPGKTTTTTMTCHGPLGWRSSLGFSFAERVAMLRRLFLLGVGSVTRLNALSNLILASDPCSCRGPRVLFALSPAGSAVCRHAFPRVNRRAADGSRGWGGTPQLLLPTLAPTPFCGVAAALLWCRSSRATTAARSSHSPSQGGTMPPGAVTPQRHASDTRASAELDSLSRVVSPLVLLPICCQIAYGETTSAGWP